MSANPTARELLDEIEKGLEGVTPGPWAAFTDDSGSQLHTNIVAVVPRTACVLSLPGRSKREADVDWIARCNPANLRTILAYVKELEGALGSIIAKHDDWRKCMPADWEGDPLSSAIDRARALGGSHVE